MSTPIPVVDLLQRIRRGDAIAVHCLYKQVEPFLRNLARQSLNANLRRQVDSTDLAQSAFRRILAGSMRARFADETRLLGWMAAIVRNRVRTLARHPEDRGGGAFDAGLDPAEEADPAAWAAHAEEVVRFRDAMQRLSERDRQIIVLRDFERLPFAALAEVLTPRMSVEALRKAHERALARVRRLLDRGAGDLPA